MMKQKIIISAGGTGGHIFPGLAIAKELSSKYEIIWVGAKTGLENTLVPKHGYLLETVSVAGVRGNGLLRKLCLPFTLIKSGVECLKILLKHKPIAIVGFGGYATFPICFTAKIIGKPIIIHEQNSVAGLTNKLCSKFANIVLTAFPNVLLSSKTFFVGNPVRQEIINSYSANKYTDTNTKIKVLIVGGSLGAKVLNETVPLALKDFGDKILTLTHQVGRADKEQVFSLYKNTNITNLNVVNFIDDMATAYKEHDLIICRSGASTVTEVAAAGIAAVFVPYPHAVDDHQTTNARYLSDHDAALLIKQPDFSVKKLQEVVNNLSKVKCCEIAEKARSYAVLDSTHKIVNYIQDAIKR
ncbi:MAG: undecaprenyldiphospho-muramoylpentapeptide beta-N-acetylglucosaminyltransferase [Burkholderiales bacterium]|nr:undecaprenyldiphospho-muramoylpentapeptide beta-N-acetylglucosaminyltransferase [Burkholderiales bacterium]